MGKSESERDAGADPPSPPQLLILHDDDDLLFVESTLSHFSFSALAIHLKWRSLSVSWEGRFHCTFIRPKLVIALAVDCSKLEYFFVAIKYNIFK